MKKGRHRRFEEARALKRSHEVDLHDLFESISDEPDAGEYKPEHDAWADLAEEWDSKSNGSSDPDEDEQDEQDESIDDVVESTSDSES